MHRFNYATLILARFLATASLSMPLWSVPELPKRLTFIAPRETDAATLISVPPSVSNGVDSTYAIYDHNMMPVDFKQLHRDSDGTILLVKSKKRHQYSVYYGSKDPGVDNQSAEFMTDSKPVLVKFYSTKAMGLPDTWQKMRHMLKREDRLLRTMHLSGFTRIETERERKDSTTYIVVMKSFLLCPTAGSHLFALDGCDGAFLTIDDKLAATSAARSHAGQWTTGKPIELEAGLHSLALYSICNSDNSKNIVRAGWMPPGETEVAELTSPDLVCASLAEPLRIEQINKTLHPSFSVRKSSSYSYRDCTPFFVPVRFRNQTGNWLDSDVQYSWDFGDGHTSLEPVPRHVYMGPGKYKATMTIRDSLGFITNCARTVNCMDAMPTAYAVDFKIANLPAACYDSDRIMPYLHAFGSSPRSAKLQVECRVNLTDNSTALFRSGLSSAAMPTNMLLFTEKAENLDSIEWRVTDHGTVLKEGTIDFMRPPFNRIPTHIDGNRLFDDKGVQLVFVPHQFDDKYAQPVPDDLSRIVHIDDWLFDSIENPDGFGNLIGTKLDEAEPVTVVQHEMHAWERQPEAFGPLQKFIQIPRILVPGRDTAILSIGLKDIAFAAMEPPAFERHVAALSDLISATLNCTLLWTTPPSFASERTDVRPYAAGIKKIALTRRIPVADLFTAFSCSTNRSGKAGNRQHASRLSAEETGITAQIIARSVPLPIQGHDE